jgi:hypothetical protein
MNGYSEITVNGHVIGLKFGMHCIKMIQDRVKKNGVSLYDGEALNQFGVAYFLFAAYENFVLVKTYSPEFVPGSLPKLTYEDFYDYVEQSYLFNKMEDISAAIEQFRTSQIVTGLKKQKEETEEKKTKSRGRKSKNSPSGK